MGKKVSGIQGNRSQAAMLRRLVRQALISVAIGGVLLLGFILFNIMVSLSLIHI